MAKSKSIGIKKSQKIDFNLSDYELSDNDEKVLKFLINYPELTQNEIAKLLNLSFETVSRIKHRPAFQKAYRKYKDEEAKTWAQVLIDARKPAAQKMVVHLNSPLPTISIRAAENILQLDKLDLSDDKPAEPPY